MIQKWLTEQGFSAEQLFFDNLTPTDLLEHAVRNNEGLFTESGAFVVNTSPYTGRSPNDKYVVDYGEDEIWLGAGSKLLPVDHFNALRRKAIAHLRDKTVYVKDVLVGAHPEFQTSVRVVTELAWQNLFADSLFITANDKRAHEEPDYTVIAATGFEADPAIDHTRAKPFIILDFKQHIVLIGGTLYAGEIKKSVFTLMNYLMPHRDVLPLHCSANVGKDGDVALFFGLSGTGKTTLSSDPTRNLVGDDEHGWSDSGIFNFEGGCYAKTIKLRKDLEPLVWEAVHRFGTIIENVPLSDNRTPDFDSNVITENTRAGYPLSFIENYVPEGYAGHPKNIFLLTADAFGVLPPLAKLSVEKALFYFINGFTSKLAGTERGLGLSPEATFSPCFGAPFLPLHPLVYAHLLEKRLKEHGTQVWLLNTGWIGGPYGVGKRIDLPYTRAMIKAVLNGSLLKGSFIKEDVFELDVPAHVDQVPDDILFPHKSWKDQDDYYLKARKLAQEFKNNFLKFQY